MSYAYEMERPLASQAMASERANFIRLTYLHVAGAILAFLACEFLIFRFVSMATLDGWVFQSPGVQLIVLIGFMAAGYIGQWWAFNGTSKPMAYAGLALYTVAEVIIFVPLLHIALHYVKDPTLLPTAGILTLSIFGGLTLAAFLTRKDFSFLRPILSIGFFLALGLILCAILFPASIKLGMWFSLLMVGLASVAILYQTSNVIHRFRTDQYVGAALCLFSAVATLFYYIVMLLIQNRSGD